MNDIMKDNCRTCLTYFSEDNRKCSLMSCLPLTSDSSRFELMKNVMTTCSLTLFPTTEGLEIPEIYICMSCLVQMDQMLNFLQKCIRSETILKQASQVKTELFVFSASTDEGGSVNHIQTKVENFNQDTCSGFNEVSFTPANDISRENNNENPKLICEECDKKFPSILSLSYHRYKHKYYKPHTCLDCHEKFQTLHLIKRHMAVKHNNGNHKCRYCSEVFPSRYHVIVHEQRLHTGKKFSCGVCKRKFSTVSSLKFHENVHLGQESSNGALLRDHEQFKCNCGRSFNTKKKLELHVETVHEKKDKTRKYECPECEKKFHHPYSLKNHLNIHLGIKPFLCNACGSAFTALSNLTSHFRRIHSGDKQPAVKKYLCHTCGEAFARTSHLQRHTLRKHVPNAEKKHECPICKKRFLEKSDVTGHVKLHDDVKPFVCEQCSKCFRTGWRRQAHVNRVHLKLRPFECPTCSVKFKTKSHLEKHIRTHTGEKPFPCPHCAYTCAEKSNLKKHINIHLKTM